MHESGYYEHSANNPNSAANDVDDDDAVVVVSAGTFEIPVEYDGSLLLSSVQLHLPFASGLWYWAPNLQRKRAIKLDRETNKLVPPHEGWGDKTYYVSIVDNPHAQCVRGEKLERYEKANELFQSSVNSVSRLMGLDYLTTTTDEELLKKLKEENVKLKEKLTSSRESSQQPSAQTGEELRILKERNDSLLDQLKQKEVALSESEKSKQELESKLADVSKQCDEATQRYDSAQRRVSQLETIVEEKEKAKIQLTEDFDRRAVEFETQLAELKKQIDLFQQSPTVEQVPELPLEEEVAVRIARRVEAPPHAQTSPDVQKINSEVAQVELPSTEDEEERLSNPSSEEDFEKLSEKELEQISESPVEVPQFFVPGQEPASPSHTDEKSQLLERELEYKNHELEMRTRELQSARVELDNALLQLNAVQRKYTELDEQIHTAPIDTNSAEFAQLQKQFNDVKWKCGELDAEVAHKNAELQHLRGHASSLESNFSKTNDELKKCKIRCKRLEETVHALHQFAVHVKKEADDAKWRCGEMEAGVYKSINPDVAGELIKEKHKNAELEKKLRDKNEEMNSITVEKKSTFDAKLADAYKQVEESKKIIDDLTAEKENQRKTSAEQIKQLEKSLTSARKKQRIAQSSLKSSSQSSISDIEKDDIIAQLQVKLSKAEKSYAEIADEMRLKLETERERSRSKFYELETAMATMNREYQEQEAKFAQREEDLLNEIDEKIREIEELKEKLLTDA